jgi:predicted amidohydrolase
VNCKNIVDCVDFLITSTSELSKNEQSAFLKVLLLQIHCSSPQRCYELMEKYLEIELSKDSGKVDMIILPEGAISYLGELPQSSIPLELQCLSNFAANHHIILICGTVTETAMINSEMKCFTTCVVFDQQGEVILKYRKRDTMGMMEDGNQVGICDTIYGKIGVLICYDAERPAFVDDTIAHSPSLIFNPAHLSTFQGIPKSLIHSSWKVALDTSSRYFEYLAHSTGVTFVRCDLAGSGNTFLVTPKQSVFIPSLSEQYMSILIPNPHHSSDNFSSSERQLTLSSDFGRIRTEKFDNTGLRATIQTMEIERKKSWKTNGMVSSERGIILKVGIILPRGRPKGRIAILSDSSLEIWDPVDSSLFYSYDLNQPPSLELDQQSESNSKSIRFVDGIIEREGVIRVYDNRQRCYE